MTTKFQRRGYDPDDDQLFSHTACLVLLTAQEEIRWLLNRGYPMGSVTELVGSHYQLTTRQRMALQRATATDRQIQARRKSLLPAESAGLGTVLIDGFNLIILLEVALSGGLLILGSDGVLRDLAGLRGTYRILAWTDQAIGLIGQSLASLHVPEAVFYLDQNVSNSGRLKQLILSHAPEWPFPVRVELVPNADTCLGQKERVVSQDSFVLDACTSWLNLSGTIVAQSIHSARIIPLAPEYRDSSISCDDDLCQNRNQTETVSALPDESGT